MVGEHEEIVRQLLRQRGIYEDADIKEFLSERPTKTYSPFLLKDMEMAVDLIQDTISKGHKICIYGDYDCDGVTSVSLMLQILRELTDKVGYYIPSRFDEGYGLNKEALYKIREDGTHLIITVDCGSVSVEEVALAKELGMDIIVTDHHTMSEKIPDCLIINPKQKDCPYPFKGLSGCGVAFKVAQALQQKAGLPKASLSRVLDLVAIGTIGDIVPLVDENRTLVKHGLRALPKTGRRGLIKLIEKIGLNLENIQSENISYIIVPHINAAGRVKNPGLAVSLLTSEEEKLQNQMVEELISANKQRKEFQEEAFIHCLSIIESQHQQDLFKVVWTEDTHEGIAGIVAGKIKERYGLPVILVTPSGEKGEYLKGTGRSIPSVDLYQLLKGGSHLFHKFGGHSGACGFMMKKEGLEELRTYLEEEMARMLQENPDIFLMDRFVDYTLRGNEISIPLIQSIEKIGPFGHGNEKPFFLIPEAEPSDITRMGASGNHLRFDALCADEAVIPCVLFNESEKYWPLLRGGERYNLRGSLGLNQWNNRMKIQFVVQDIT